MQLILTAKIQTIHSLKRSQVHPFGYLLDLSLGKSELVYYQSACVASLDSLNDFACSRAEKEERATLCKFVHRAYNQNLVTSSSGSFSARLGAKDGEDLSFIITPTDVDRRSLEPSHLCFVSSDSQPARKKQEFETNEPKLRFHPMHPPGDPEKVSPSRATALHGSIYSMHPEVNYIMVVQPPFATSYCITGRPFNSAGIPESHIILQNVQSLSIDSVLENNGVELSRALDPSAGKSTILVEGYGLVTVGQDLLKTFVQVEVCESMCGTLFIII